MNVVAATTVRASGDDQITSLVPAARVYQGWYKAEEKVPQLAFMAVALDTILEGGQGSDTAREQRVQATASAELLSGAHAIIDRLENLLSDDWMADGYAYTASYQGRVEQPGADLNSVAADFIVSREAL